MSQRIENVRTWISKLIDSVLHPYHPEKHYMRGRR